MPEEIKLFTTISRSHVYWGRKPIAGILQNLSMIGIREGDLVIDPFCGGGTPAIAMLLHGARVIASDLNPMAVFLTKTIVRPLEIASLYSAFEQVRQNVAEAIEKRYQIKCPRCSLVQPASGFQWQGPLNQCKPIAVKLRCTACKKRFFRPLSPKEIDAQLRASHQRPAQWYPQRPIPATMNAPIRYYHELFTGRNLSALAQLHAAIRAVRPDSHRDALLYAFTAMLYECSAADVSTEQRSSSGRSTLGLNVPNLWMEKNVWQAFRDRFNAFVQCKILLNSRIPGVRIAESIEEFTSKRLDIFVRRADATALPYTLGKEAKLVFLDPPNTFEVDYMGLSELWGAWLAMPFYDRNSQLIPSPRSPDDYPNRMQRMLAFFKWNTSPSTSLSLTFSSSNPSAKALEKAIEKAGFALLPGFSRAIVYPIAKKTGAGLEEYRLLTRKSFRGRGASHNGAPPSGAGRAEREEVKRYVRAVALMAQRQGLRGLPKILAMADGFIPGRLRGAFKEMQENFRPQGRGKASDKLKDVIVDRTRNRADYHALCLRLLMPVFAKDRLRVEYLNERLFTGEFLGSLSLKLPVTPSLPSWMGSCAFTAASSGPRLVFCFDDQDQRALKAVSSGIRQTDGDRFGTIAVLIVCDSDAMNKCRAPSNADKWERGFFVSFEELLGKCRQIAGSEAENLCAFPQDPGSRAPRRANDIRTLTAKVVKQYAVGKGNSHRKLRFEIEALQNIAPGQFIMIQTDPLPEKSSRSKPGSTAATSDARIQSIAADTQPSPYLKRPFGIHRAFYKHFSEDYLQHLHLPRTLATIMHTVHPHRFDVFYKILENGIGTHRLSHAKKGDSLEIMGPLGSRYNLREILQRDAIREVHVIGGGVGMAPLVFFVQALRFFSYPVKAFIGIESLDVVRWQGKYVPGESYAETQPNDFHIFVDDLKQLGLSDDDIFVSSDKPSTTRHALKHYWPKSLVSDNYSDYLKRRWKGGKTLAFTCGPEPMMKAISRIAADRQIPLNVLMERRMACGIGVCFSCVCSTKTDSGEKKSRVCLDGPLYSSEAILWK